MDVNLVLFKKDGMTRSFRLPSTVTVIGRRQESDLCIPLMVVSRRHCELNVEMGRLKIRDLGSRNGTYVNGQRVDQGETFHHSPDDDLVEDAAAEILNGISEELKDEDVAS